MIDNKTKNRFLKELEKSGNIYLSCLKIGVDRSTYYRWFESNKDFRKRASQAVRRGKENICDIAKHALMIKVKDKDMRAIEYVLSHNDPDYKQKHTSNVVILHKKDVPVINNTVTTLEDLLQQDDESRERLSNELNEKIIKSGLGMPLKPDGTPIQPDEVLYYEKYINDWLKFNKPSSNQT